MPLLPFNHAVFFFLLFFSDGVRFWFLTCCMKQQSLHLLYRFTCFLQNNDRVTLMELNPTLSIYVQIIIAGYLGS